MIYMSTKHHHKPHNEYKLRIAAENMHTRPPTVIKKAPKPASKLPAWMQAYEQHKATLRKH